MGQVNAINFPGPGFLGLNREQEQVPLGPEWAVRATNGLIDSAGRMSSRKGWVNQTTVAFTGNTEQLHEYVDAAGATTLIAAGGDKLWESSDNGSTWTDRTGALTPTGADNWQFVNFNGKCFAVKSGHAIIRKTSGNFATFAAATGTLPPNPVAIIAAFGRIWCVGSDLQTIYYCALLDETKWATADGGGLIDMRTVWTHGIDTVTALAALGARFIVLGTQNIVLWVDGTGSELGIDPLTMIVEDTIEGTGTTARDSVCNIGEGDLYFLGPNGVRSLVRSRIEVQTPVTDLSANNRSYFNALVQDSTVDKTKIRGVYSSQESFYLLSVPDSLKTFCFDTRLPLQDSSLRFFEWELAPLSLCFRRNKDLLFGFGSGIVGKYSGYNDNAATYRFEFRSAFLKLGPEIDAFLKQIKRIKVMCYVSAATMLIVKWAYDFSPDQSTQILSLPASATSEYGDAQFGVDEFGGSSGSRQPQSSGGGYGQYFQVGIEVEIDGSPFAIRNITTYYTMGRLA